MRLRSRIAIAVGRAGLYRATLALTASRPRILMYHRFSRGREDRRLHEAEFARQLDILKRDFRVVALGEYGRWLAEGSAIPPRVAVITVDDGYRDFYDIAYPLLRARGLPATLFVATDAVDHGAWLWPDRVEYVLATTEVPQFSLEGPGFRLAFALRNRAGLRSAWDAFVGQALCVPNDTRLEMLRQLEERAGVTVPARAVDGFDVCSWAQLAEMAAGGIEIGGHTRSHPVLSRIPVEQLDAEIGGCRARLREKLGVAATTFCYPNGMPGDVSAQARAAVERAGYTCAVVAHSNYARSVDPFRIERIAVGSSERYFNEAVYGVDHARTRMALRAVPVPEPALR